MFGGCGWGVGLPHLERVSASTPDIRDQIVMWTLISVTETDECDLCGVWTAGGGLQIAEQGLLRL